MKTYLKPSKTRDLRTNGSVTLALGEATGHHHTVYADINTDMLPDADFFEEPSGRRVLLARQACVLRHQEHPAIALDPEMPVQVRQGDVLLNPIGTGAWEVIQQKEYVRGVLRRVVD